MSPLLHSRVCTGSVRHRRNVAPARCFRQRVTMLYLDLDELAAAGSMSRLFGVERARVWSFRRRDYLGPADRPLAEAARDAAERATGVRPTGPVRLLTQVRSLGYVFNPVSFYYCFDADGTTLAAVVAEITNTPWGERHHYVVGRGAERGGTLHGAFAKQFHVSPFLGMDHRYAWAFQTPSDRIAVTMRNERAGERAFTATLALRTVPFTARALRRALLRMPLPSVFAHLAIYWQALRLALRRAPFFPHPRQPHPAPRTSHVRRPQS